MFVEWNWGVPSIRSIQNIEREFTKSSHNPSSVYKTCNGVPSHVPQIASIILFQLIMEGFWSEVAKIKDSWANVHTGMPNSQKIVKNGLIAKNYPRRGSEPWVVQGIQVVSH